MKKKLYKILTICLCFMFIFFAGCSDGGLGISDGDGDTSMGEPPKSLDGVKALMKPEDYSISDLVGENSEYFYNLFSYYVIRNLVDVYSDMYNGLNDLNISNPELDTSNISQILKGTNLINLKISDDVLKEEINYYYDSIRHRVSCEVDEELVASFPEVAHRQ